ncbi:MAG TPA: nitrate- and nitrite sensing domain-containing protein [Trebonia sp.]|nr:nitrate- and nitrite sensing domain-containing protein [Trebonia sp.]
MRSGAVDREPGRGPTRLVPQADGYADYVDPAREESRPAGQGQHRSGTRHVPGRGQARNSSTGSFRIKGAAPAVARRGQRPILITIIWLLILPTITMVALYLYAAIPTIAPAEAKGNSAATNADIGQTDEAMVQAVEEEQADTFAWQASGHRATQVDLKKDYQATTGAVAAFEAGLSKAQGVMPDTTKQASPALLKSLASLTSIRAGVAQPTAVGPQAALETFNRYLLIQGQELTWSNSLSNPNASDAEVLESEALINAGTGTEDMSDVATLLGGVLAGGGFMTPGEYQEFEKLYNSQEVNFGLVNQPSLWRVSPDPYFTSVNGSPAAMSTAPVRAALKLEALVLADGSSRSTVQIPITPAQLEGSFRAALSPPNGPLIVAEEASRLAITADDNHEGTVIKYRLIGIGLGGLLVVILSVLLLLRFGTRISRELTGLRNAAQVLSGERLPSVVRRLRAGDDVDVNAEAPPLHLGTRTREVTETADAFSAVQHTAIEAAVEQATLRKGVSSVFRSLARRNQSLVQRQLRMLDEMERGTQDPDALAQLFRLDHLTTRMRRQAEGLIILSGSAPSRRWRQPVAVVEVLRGAISEIEDYVRVDLVTDSPDYLTGAAVADVTHLLAELIENAVVYSPPATRVVVRGGRVANGYVIEVEDRGLGVPPAVRDTLNERLAQPPDFDLTDSDQLGLFVVSRLAIRNGIKVSLRESGFGGTTAIVLLPSALVVTEDEAKALAAQGPQGTPASRGAIGSGHRPTEEDRAVLASRRAPRLDLPVAAAHDEPDLSQSFGSRRLARGSFARPAPDSGPFASGTLPTRGATSAASGPADDGGSPGAAAVPARGDGGRGAFGTPAPFQDAPAASPLASAGDGGGQSDGEGPAGLPKRQKMASLAPQLRENRPQDLKGSVPGRSPEQARALLSSIQRGLRTGRDSPAGDDPGTGSQAGGGDQAAGSGYSDGWNA